MRVGARSNSGPSAGCAVGRHVRAARSSDAPTDGRQAGDKIDQMR